MGIHHPSSNAVCLSCAEGSNGINGRYCKAMGRYVEHDRAPRCDGWEQKKRNATII